MAWVEDEYKEWQDNHEEVEGEWDDDWSDEEKQKYYENLEDHNEEYVYQYKEWQDKYEEVEGEWDDDWSDEEKQKHYEKLKDHNEEYVYHLCFTNSTLLRSLLLR